MILEEETFEAFGYCPKDLMHGTKKLIIAPCTLCGEFRIVRKHYYKTFCRTCIKRCTQRSPGIYNHFTPNYRRDVRKLFGNKCFLCGRRKQRSKRKLEVHHVLYNQDGDCIAGDCICVPLCRSCHTKTNTDRDYWQALIMEMLKPLEAWSN